MESRKLSIAECFSERVLDTPDEVAIEYKEEFYTWIQLEQFTEMLAMEFLNAGIKESSHIGICCRNNPQWVCIFLALQKIGAIAVLINPQSTITELEKIIHLTDIEYLCFDNECKNYNLTDAIQACTKRYMTSTLFVKNRLDNYYKEDKTFASGAVFSVLLVKYCRQVCDSLQSTYSGSNSGSACNIGEDKGGDSASRSRKCMEVDVACILLTSGTSSKPKAVMLSHCNLISIAEATCAFMKWTCKDKICMIMPLYHILGISGGLLSSICCGCSMVLTNDLVKLLKTIERYRCTVLNGTPAVFLSMIQNQSISKYDLSSLKSGYSGGSFLSGYYYNEIRKILGLENFQISYGLTEASGGITFTSYHDKNDIINDNVGSALEGVEIEIADALPGSRSGEVLVKGPGVMQGYYKAGCESKRAVDENGWLHTGDMGYLDEYNCLHITGRAKEVIIWNGENISPFEIEEVIMSYSGIAMTKVFGFPSNAGQEEIAACIEMEAGKELNERELRKYMADVLIPYKIPKYFIILDKIPVLTNGKINLSLLRDIVEARYRKS